MLKRKIDKKLKFWLDNRKQALLIVGVRQIDCYSVQLNSSINVVEVEHLISKELADRLRKRYFE